MSKRANTVNGLRIFPNLFCLFVFHYDISVNDDAE